MEKLTLEHLAGYLPYGVNFISTTGKKAYWTENGAYYGHRTSFGGNGTTSIHFNTFLRNYKPVLRPLSDLPNSELFKKCRIEHDVELRYDKRILLDVKTANCIDLIGYPLQFITELYKEHYDIHNLIPLGLAIDINKSESEVK